MDTKRLGSTTPAASRLKRRRHIPRDQQQFDPVTFGYLRLEAKWLHLYCTVCGHEREFDVSKPPFAHLPDATVVPKLGRSMVCSKCGTKGKIWSVPEFHGASKETLARWRQLAKA